MMRVVERFPHRVREVPLAWIPLTDGARLSARLWLPEGAEAQPVPAILEYLPYRHRDGTAERDARTHPYLAGHGYACVRVDLRGAGDSDGVLRDEYLPQEQDDALEVIAWIARQPWCTGAVGMMGISWGGFNALQVAARRPPALRAIVTVCSTHDRYADDTHYPGGAWLAGNLGWGANFFAFLTCPPDPLAVGERWRKIWEERLEALEPPVATWLAHQRRDAYWRHGSVGEDYGAIASPAFVVGGWADGYTNAVGRLLAGLRGPRKGLIGPWGHAYPHLARPHPMGFLQEVLRWWDQWLKGIDTGVMAEPDLRAWIEDVGPPEPRFVDRPGRFVAEPVWPSPSIRRDTWHLGPGVLLREPGREGAVAMEHRSPETVGLAGGVWCPYGFDGELPADQREDDAFSLCFDSVPLSASLELLGTPEVTLDLAVDRPSALFCARLCAVGPGGASTRLSYGLLNLQRRDGFDRTAPIVPGMRYRVTLCLNDVGCAVPAGYRLRLALSTAYWPMVWPSPDSPGLTVFTGGRLVLPARAPRPEDARLAALGPSEAAAPGRVETVRPPHRRTTIERDLATETFVAVNVKDRGRLHFPEHGLTIDARGGERLSIRRGDPLSARAETSWTIVHARGEWWARAETRMTLTADAEAFRLTARVEAYEGDALVHARDWDHRIPRDGL